MDFPTDEAMKMMARMAVEKATTDLADFAEDFAKDAHTKMLSGPGALKAFAAAIRNRNTEMYGPSGSGS